jgi:hypothetical protein
VARWFRWSLSVADQLLVYGENFTFGVKEPPGWNGDITNAEKFQSNVVLHESGQPLDSTSGLIRIRRIRS